MEKIHKFLSRYRLISSMLALVVLLGALAVSPAEANGGCDIGCVSWTKESGACSV